MDSQELFRRTLEKIKSVPAFRSIAAHLRQKSPFLILNRKDKFYLRFAPPGHHYSTIPNRGDITTDQDRIFSLDDRELLGINCEPDIMLSLLDQIAALYKEFPYENEDVTGLRYQYNNGMYPTGDALVLYSITRLFKPQCIIEVGSGMSTCILLDTNEIFLNNSASITCIDPYPERLMKVLHPNDHEIMNLIPKRIQDVDVNIFDELKANDIVLVDSTHVSKCGSDVNHIIFDILPRLKPGVLVHFHDIFYPFEYPKQWLLELGIAWNELYLLRAFLQYNNAFEILFFCDYMTRKYRATLETSIPLFLSEPGVSIWLRRNTI